MKLTGKSPAIISQVSGSTATVRFNRSAERNSLPTSTLELLQLELSELFGRADVRAIIFTGTDGVFLSGADIRELFTLDEAHARDFSQRGQQLFQRIADSRKLTVAAINGYCMGGGLDLALACDIRIASASSVFAHPGARLGIITGWGGTQRLPRLIGGNKTLELFLTARRFTSEEALHIGLITGIHDPVLEAAVQLVSKLTSTSSIGNVQSPSDSPPSSWQ
jgi:enoyl-CoA hydratase